MLDARFIRTEPAKVRQGLINKNFDTGLLDKFLELDEKRRADLYEVEKLKAERNAVSEEIAKMKKNRQDATSEIERMRDVSQRIKAMDADLAEIESELSAVLMNIPNMPHESVPVGKDETENRTIRAWGEPRQFDFERGSKKHPFFGCVRQTGKRRRIPHSWDRLVRGFGLRKNDESLPALTG